MKKVLEWFKDPSTIETKVSLKHRHSMVKKIWASDLFEQTIKDEVLAELKKIDSSDEYETTAKYCQAAIPTLENKEAIWKILFGQENDKLSLYDIENYCVGFRPIIQRALCAPFADRFFEEITHIVETQAVSKASKYFYNLRPNLEANDAEIKAFEIFNAKLNTKEVLTDGERRLKGWIEDTIADLKSK